MNIVAFSEKGLFRAKNEDKFCFKILSDDISWAIICDGMGGASSGDIASGLASKVVEKEIANFNTAIQEDKIKSFIIKILNKANLEIYKKSKEKKTLEGMGTTAVFVLVFKNKAIVFHAGDSRAYSISGNKINQITTDHSLVQEMFEQGKINSKELKNHPRKNIITRSFGIKEKIEIDCSEMEFNEKQILLLLTDGVTNYVKKSKIMSIFKSSDNHRTFAKSLIKTAKDLGSNDDATVLVISR